MDARVITAALICHFYTDKALVEIVKGSFNMRLLIL